MKKCTLKKEQVKKGIIYRIVSGQYFVNGRIPSERELCETLCVSRITIRSAVDELVEEGVLLRDGRRGTLIKEVPRHTSTSQVSSKRILFVYFSSIKGHPIEQTGSSSRLYHGIERFANEHHHVLLVQSGENFVRQSSADYGTVDGIIAGGVYLEKHLPAFIGSGIPTIAIDSIPHRLNVDAISGDYYEAGIRAADKALARKLKNPLFILLRFEDEDFIQPKFMARQRGFLDALEGTSTVGHIRMVNYSDLSCNGKTVKELFACINKNHVDGIIYCVDILYSLLYMYKEIATLPAIIIGGGGATDCMGNSDLIDRIVFDIEYIGYLAAQRLHERMQNPCLGIIRYLIPSIAIDTVFTTNMKK
jgi:DNA-binding transcriptional regulator YhcF (GntR family)